MEIPVIELKGPNSKDPIKLIEAMSNLGAQYGAVKLVIPEGKERDTFTSNVKIDPETFWFASTKVLGKSQTEELESRLNFHGGLVRFHMESMKERELKGGDKEAEISKVKTENAEKETIKSEARKENVIKEDGEEKGREPFQIGTGNEPFQKGRVEEVGQIEQANASVQKEEIEKCSQEASIGETSQIGHIGETSQKGHIGEESHLDRITPLKEPNSPIPSFIDRPPTIKGRVVDLYKLFKAVVFRGGFTAVEKSNEWTQIGLGIIQIEDEARDLNALKDIYRSVLLPFENLEKGREYSRKNPLKRLAQEDSQAAKRAHVEETPLLLGSAKEFKRYARVKAAKGILLNSPYLVSSRKCKPTKKEANKPAEGPQFKNMTPLEQLNHSIRNTYLNQTIQQDSRALDESASFISLREFMENDSRFQKAHQLEGLNVQTKERLFWDSIARNNGFETAENGGEIYQGTDISSLLNDVGIATIGDGLISHKRPTETGQLSEASLTNILKRSLHPWNLQNLPILPNSLFGALSESDMNNRDLFCPVLNVGMTFSTENWRCEDHFTQLCNYHLYGASKRWYFIPEDQFDKFESLIKEVSQKNAGKRSITPKASEIQGLMLNFADMDTAAKAILMDSLSRLAYPQSEERLQHSNEAFQQLIASSSQNRSIALNQEFLITPELLHLRGIRFTTATQNPGEFIFKYPKTYSATISLGINVSESVNVATKNWLSYAIEGEKWLAKQGIIPCFLTFKMLVNLAQLYETPGNDIHFSPEVYATVVEMYNYCFGREVYLRNLIREKAKYIREFVVDEKTFGDVDPISDDSLENTFPSKIVLTDTQTSQTFILSLSNFLDYIQVNEKEQNDEKKTVPVLSSPQFRVDLFLFYSDEKLKGLRKVLSSYSIDYEKWMKSYESQMSQTEELSLKSYRSLLSDGEKIYQAICLVDFIQEFYGNEPSGVSKDAESTKIGVFKGYIENLRQFLAQSNAFIEECQTLLLVKHQQRIRGNDSALSKPVDLTALASIIERIPKVNFSCVEFDQIFELQNEIENFDRACKSLFQTNNKSIAEFNDLISLGESFGLEIPSLSFIIRLRDRLKWLEVYNTIVNGGDPFGDKKDHFTVVDLKMFFAEGLKILGRDDAERAKTVESIIRGSDDFNSEVDGFFSQFSALDEMDLLMFDRIFETFESKAKSRGRERVFMSFENLVRLLDVKGHYDLFPRLKEFRAYVENESRTNEPAFAYHEVRNLKTAIDESKLGFNTLHLINSLFATERWVYQLWEYLRETHQVTTFKTLVDKKDGVNARYSLNGPLIKKLLLMIEKNKFSFASETDTYYASAAYQANKEKEEGTEKGPLDGEETEDEQDDQTPGPVPSDAPKGLEGSSHGVEEKAKTPEPEAPMIYCICREYEFGTMIECDHCNEWYHIHCVEDQEEQTASDDDSYMCPVCKLLGSDLEKDGFLQKQATLTRLEQKLDEGRLLKTCPLNEYNKIRDVCSSTNEYKKAVSLKVQEIKENTAFSARKKTGYLKFMLRKVYGAGVILEDILLDLLQAIRVFEKELKQQEDMRKAVSAQQEREFKEREDQVRKEQEEADLLSKVAQLAAYTGIEPLLTGNGGTIPQGSLPTANIEDLPKVETFATQNGISGHNVKPEAQTHAPTNAGGPLPLIPVQEASMNEAHYPVQPPAISGSPPETNTEANGNKDESENVPSEQS